MLIRKARTGDAGWIARICNQQFKVAHLDGFIHDDLDYYVDKTFNPAAVKRDIEQASHHYFVAENSDGITVGCIKLAPADLPLALGVAGAVEITRFYLLPGYIGKGVGALLMHQAIDWCRRHRAISMWLHVYKGNQSAINFYKKWQFEIVGELDFPVRNSRPVGWVMKRPV
jgi:diamine N-acetyltransferase